MKRQSCIELLFAAGCWVSLGVSSAAVAETVISAESPDQILDIAKGYGSAALEKDAEGDPYISGRIDGTKYGILFYGCTDGKACKDIQFVAVWDAKVSMDKVNKWNSDSKFGTASIDEDGDTELHMAVNLAHGVSRNNLDDTFDWWKVVMKEFSAQALAD